MTTAIIVPARLASNRFPQKLLHAINGTPLILWTARRIRAEAPEYPLFFAVDGPRLKEVLETDGFDAVLTDPDLPSGTDRIAAANAHVGAARVINVQGDEPMVTGAQIRMLDNLLGEGIDMATLGTPLHSGKDFRDPNHVKMVRTRTGRALYFSRAPIPYIRDAGGCYDSLLAGPDDVLIHLGLYAYTAAFLAAFASLPPSPLERLERLEMLRALENGYSIAAGITPEGLIEIDTPENVAEFASALTQRSIP